MVDAIAPSRRDRDDYDATAEPTALTTRDAPNAKTVRESRDVLAKAYESPSVDYARALANPTLRASVPAERYDGPLRVPAGIELAAVETVPHADRDDPMRSITCPPYVLRAQVLARADGTTDVAYFTAFNTESKRVEYIVKPEAVEAFKENVLAYEVGANVALMNGGPSREYQRESVRAVDSVIHGDVLGGAKHVSA